MARKSAAVVDTNVAVVASGRAPQATADCASTCRRGLLDITRGRTRLVLDAGFEIFEEYRSRLSLGGQPGVGDMFLLWVHQHQFDPERCERVELTPHPDVGYREFPEDPDLAAFDPSDRKFAAAARASRSEASVWNAVDSDWWDHRDALRRHGIRVEFLCDDVVAAWERDRPR